MTITNYRFARIERRTQAEGTGVVERPQHPLERNTMSVIGIAMLLGLVFVLVIGIAITVDEWTSPPRTPVASNSPAYDPAASTTRGLLVDRRGKIRGSYRGSNATSASTTSWTERLGRK